MMVAINGDTVNTTESTQYLMEDVRRAREFYQYLQPDNLISPQLRRRASTFDLHHEHVPSLSAALAPFCQLAVLRCDATKAMLNVMDRDVMYFLAESSRNRRDNTEEVIYDFVEDPILISCSSVPLKGRICELTIRSDAQTERGTPFFVIPDLTQSQFANMGIVTGPPYYRFYAGVPIATRDGINIGSLAVMDIKARRDGLTAMEEEFLSQTAQQIMLYLETNRQAIEGRRSRRMAQGLESFIGGRGSIVDEPEIRKERTPTSKSNSAYGLPDPLHIQLSREQIESQGRIPQEKRRNHSIVSLDSYVSTSEMSTENEDVKEALDPAKESSSYSNTFARAANLLRECMGDLGQDGIVCFQSLRPRFGAESGPILSSKRSSPTANIPASNGGLASTQSANASHSITNAQIIASSTLVDPFGSQPQPKPVPRLINTERLRDIMNRYPNGYLWTLEDPSYSSSEEDAGESTLSLGLKSVNSRRSSKRKRAEINDLRVAFPGARQVLFAPLWDATIGSSAHAVFVAAALETRSFSAAAELSFLNAFCSTLMAECSRLDTMMADKQKSDFVGTISHEMRSPLHGVLASVEFLAETDVNGFQKSLIDTIDSCGRTLLDTINHVLDFSKVNSFQKHWQASNKKAFSGGRRNHYLGPDNSSRSLSSGAPPLLQLFAVTDIAAVLEEVVDGLVLGNTYNSGIDITDTSREARGRGQMTGGISRSSATSLFHVDPVDITIDVEPGDWSFLTQPGAVRRIIMNITGNAIKYTSQGQIKIGLRLKETGEPGESTEAMVLTVSDSGIGISPEFLSTKLFVPFAQENALAPGTGLGMSIVRSIVLMLGGAIDVKSTVGKGTTVEVVLPLQRPIPGQLSTQNTPESISTTGSGSTNTESLLLLQNQGADVTITLYRRTPLEHDESADMIQKYVQQWYKIAYVDPRMVANVSAVVVKEEDLDHLVETAIGTPDRRPAIVVLCSVSSKHSATFIQSLENRVSSAIEFVAKPFGPYKLARSLRTALEKKKLIAPRFPQVRSLQAIEEALTPHPTMITSPGAEIVDSDLQEMDLNLAGESDSAKVVQATETFAASQRSQHAQMAINDPQITAQTPQSRSGLNEANAFPFPTQDDSQHRPIRENSEVSKSSLHLKRSISSTNSDRTPRPQDQLLSQAFDPNNPRVLLVDDNKINLKLLETFLKSKRKYTRITQAEDGQQAVDTFTAAKESFDIVFMDISMPILNGFEATRAIREYERRTNKPGAMVIALTGLASGRDQSEGFDSGCDIYMTKPVSFKEVGKLLNNWEEHQKLNLLNDLGALSLGPQAAASVDVQTS